MKKQIITSLFILWGCYSHAQIGVNTETPKTTLDVSVRTHEGDDLVDKEQYYGIQAPRLTRLQLTSLHNEYGPDQTGALIYITSIIGGNNEGPRVNIDAIGYYYFDGTQWYKLTNRVDVRDINQQNNIDAENGLTNDFNTISLGGKLIKNTDINTDGHHLSFSGNGNVSIGTTTAVAKLNINDQFKFFTPKSGENPSDDSLFEIGNGPGLNRISTGTMANLGFWANGQGKTDDLPQLILEGTTGNLGIGTAIPAAKIHTVSTESGNAFQMVDGTQGEGKFLISDKDGKATWSELSTTVNSAKSTVIGNMYDLAGKIFANSYNSIPRTNIKLTKGKWLIYVGMMITSGKPSTPTTNAWIRLTLSDTYNYNPNINPTEAFVTRNNFSMPAAPLVRGQRIALVSTNTSPILVESVYYSFASGVILVDIQNTPDTDNTLTLYLSYEKNIFAGFVERDIFISNNRENYFFAVPINN